MHARGVTGVKSLEQLAASDPFHRAHGEPAAPLSSSLPPPCPRERTTQRSNPVVVF